MYIISSCLAGKNCKYNGGNNHTDWVVKLMEEEEYILVCPERASGLPAPRPPAEIIEGRVIDKDGNDVTDDFIAGTRVTMDTIEKQIEQGRHIDKAILKANSPSCGYGTVYDGTFSGEKVKGDGIFGKAMRERDIEVVNENDEKLRRKYG